MQSLNSYNERGLLFKVNSVSREELTFEILCTVVVGPSKIVIITKLGEVQKRTTVMIVDACFLQRKFKAKVKMPVTGRTDANTTWTFHPPS